MPRLRCFDVAAEVATTSVVMMLGRIAAKHKAACGENHRGAVARACRTRSPRCSKRSMELLAKRNEAADVVASQLPGQLDSLAPSVPGTSLEVASAGTCCRRSRRPQVPVSSTWATTRFRRHAELPSLVSEQAGIDAVLQPLDGKAELTAVAFDPIERTATGSWASACEPIQTLDELIEPIWTIAVETLHRSHRIRVASGRH